MNQSSLFDDIIKSKEVVLTVTGHRKKGLFTEDEKYVLLSNKIYQCILYFIKEYGVSEFRNGAADGADELFFNVVNAAKTHYPSIKNIVYIPFKGHRHPQYLEDLATSVHICNNHITSHSPMHERVSALLNRNSEMLIDCNFVLGIYSGDITLISNTQKARGGTLDCLRKAYKKGLPIVILNPLSLQTTRINF